MAYPARFDWHGDRCRLKLGRDFGEPADGLITTRLEGEQPFETEERLLNALESRPSFAGRWFNQPFREI